MSDRDVQNPIAPLTHRPVCGQPARGPLALPAGMSPLRRFAIINSHEKWLNGTVLHYCFLERDGLWDWPEAQKAVVRGAFTTWKALGIGLSFVEVAKESEAEILIGRLQDNTSWSFVGKQSLTERILFRTMNFGWDLTTPWGGATAIHEIGHSLGMEHEHQNPLSGIIWNDEAVYEYYARTNGWDREKTFHNVLEHMPMNSVQGSKWDPKSVMHYPVEPGLIKAPKPYDTQGIGENLTISELDALWVRHWYPPLAKPKAITPMSLEALPIAAGAQRDFVFEPDATRDYTIQTVGPVDSRIVVFEERDGVPRHLDAADDAGTDDNATIRTKLVDARRYFVRVRTHYADGIEPVGLLLR